MESPPALRVDVPEEKGRLLLPSILIVLFIEGLLRVGDPAVRTDWDDLCLLGVILVLSPFLALQLVDGIDRLRAWYRGERLLAVGPEGFSDRRLGMGTIAWCDVEAVTPELGGVWVRVRGLPRYRSAMPWLQWLMNRPWEELRGCWREQVFVMTIDIDLEPEALAELMEAHRRQQLPATPEARPASAKKKDRGGESGGDESEVPPSSPGAPPP